MHTLLTFAPIGVIKRDVGAIARRLIADSSEDIFPNYDGSCSSEYCEAILL